MTSPAPRLVPCRHPRQGANHDKCPTCRGTGLLEFYPATGELVPCRRKQEWDPYQGVDPARTSIRKH